MIANLLDNAAQVRRRRHRAWRCAGSTTASRSPSRTGARACPRRTASSIFDRFARGGVGRAARQPPRASGLGLALVAEHVHLHGGQVWVEDRADGEEGARFVVELPVEDHE